MTEKFDAVSLVEKGQDLYSVEGDTIEEVFKNVAKNVELPEYITGEMLAEELLNREKILSTAVGKGVAIPHPKAPVMKSEDDCRIIVCFLRNTLDMKAPDSRRVSSLFSLLSNSTQFHIKALSSLAKILKDDSFTKALALKPSKDNLLELMSKVS